jgi:two-component system, sensor histidine kinase RpfC
MLAGGRQIPSIGLIADPANEVRQQAVDAGMDVCLTKPVDSETLLDASTDAAAVHANEANAARNSGTVTSLANHPRVRADKVPIINNKLLESLAASAGDRDAFLKEAHKKFLADTTSLMEHLRNAIRHDNTEQYEDHLKNLRSEATMIGAEKLDSIARRGLDFISAKSPVEAFPFLALLNEEIQQVSNALGALWSQRPTPCPTSTPPTGSAA